MVKIKKTKNPKKPAPALGQSKSFPRLSTGVPGLDTVICGGFLVGGTYLILGSPGCGKTILANQIGFHESRDGRRAVYVTLLAENHTRMFGHLDSLEFFDRKQISDSVQYVSGYGVLEKEGLEGLLKLLGALVQRHKSTVLFIDGVASAQELSNAPINFKKFVHNLNSVLGMSGCTTFLLSSVQGDASRPEYTMVDGIVSLTLQHLGMKTAREIEVSKFRGGPHLHGRHFFEITDSGITVYPRFEAAFKSDLAPVGSTEKRLSTGTKSLDAILDGGLVPSSVTALLGPAGTGKTTIGMRFLEEGARNGETVVFLNLYEHPDRIEQKLAQLGSRFKKYVDSGKLHVIRRFPTEYLLDKLIYQLVDTTRQLKAKRVFIDGLAGMKQPGTLGSERLQDVLKCLAAELRSLGATTLWVEETDIGDGLDVKALSLDSAVTDNIIEFQHGFINHRRTQTICALKTRESAHRRGLFEFEHTEQGPKVGLPLRLKAPINQWVEYAHDEDKPSSKRRTKRS